jgi:hypothetical protein
VANIGPDGPGDEFDQTELFQAHTVGGTYVPRERVTTNFGGSETDLRRALGGQDGGWVSASLATAGFLNFWPDVAMSGTTTYVTWNRDGRTVQANNATGVFLSHTFTAPALQSRRPRIAVGPGQVVVGWTTTAFPSRAFVAERAGTSWSATAS